MAKKKKKKEQGILKEVDLVLDNTYTDLRQEIEDIQIELYESDRKALKKQRKKLKNKKEYVFNNFDRIENRKHAVSRLEGCGIFEKIENAMKDLLPIAVVFSKLIQALICSILSLDIVKKYINPETLRRMDSIYKFAKQFA